MEKMNGENFSSLFHKHWPLSLHGFSSTLFLKHAQWQWSSRCGNLHALFPWLPWQLCPHFFYSYKCVCYSPITQNHPLQFGMFARKPIHKLEKKSIPKRGKKEKESHLAGERHSRSQKLVPTSGNTHENVPHPTHSFSTFFKNVCIKADSRKPTLLTGKMPERANDSMMMSSGGTQCKGKVPFGRTNPQESPLGQIKEKSFRQCIIDLWNAPQQQFVVVTTDLDGINRHLDSWEMVQCMAV